jgi:hypothetical protein
VLYTTDLPSLHTTTGTFADYMVILARHADPVTASQNLQGHLDQLETWLKNETKSMQVTLTLRKEQCPAVCMNNIHSTIIKCKVSWPPFGFQTKMEAAYSQKKKTDRSKSKRHLLDHQTKINHITR